MDSSSSCSNSNSASTSPPPPPDPPSSSVIKNKKRKRESCVYDVFLSFRGEDTRKSFVDHLYVSLGRHEFSTFKDDKRLRGGESISHKLLEAIEQSRSAIVVFSKNYASSSWCLDELVKIMDQFKEENLAVYPVFYDVDPSEVRRQTGIFGQGFAKAAERKADKADAWRKALQDASNLSGYDLRKTADGLESQCIEKVVEWCSSHSYNISSIDEDLIGMPARVRKLKLLLGGDLDDVRMIGIWGMGGVGKTTVAYATFHEVKKQFDSASFIADVREKSKTIVGLQLLQQKLMSDILMETYLKVDSVAEGKEMIKSRLGQKKVLIVLDDVDDDEQLHALAGDRKWFGKGSRVLITTRDQHLLDVQGVEKNDVYNVNLLSEDEAILLFNRHAFKKKCNPTKEYNELSLRVVRYANGLPLALKVLGSFLCGRGMAEWTSALNRLEKIPERKILEKLQLSYDGLKQAEKEIFLDIACFFKEMEMKMDEVIRILDSCEFDPIIGINVLVQKSLISLSNNKTFEMHDLLQEMGRNIGRQSRLWHDKDTREVLQNNTGTEAIEAIIFHRYTCEEQICDSKAFMSMKKLRLLYFKNYRCTSFVGPEYLPNELRWLSWYRYRHASLPESFQARKLVGLDMKFSCIVQLWEGTKLLDKLKLVDLSFSKELVRTPDFSGSPNLETLNLRECLSLIEVHPSIGDLPRLVSLDLTYCQNLLDFPSNIHAKSLEFLSFNGCSKFKRFPELCGDMDRLSVLHLNCTGIKDLPSSIANLTKLVSIDLCGCRNLLNLPDTICTLKNLKTMDLRHCTKLGTLPENLGCIESLEELKLSDSGVKVLPSRIGHLKKLRLVSLSGCRELILEDVMAHIGSCLKVLDLSYCSLSDHQAIHIDIGQLSFLEDLKLGGNPFAFVPFIISQLPRLKILDLFDCKELKALPELPSSIAIVRADDCTSLECIKSLSAGKHEWLWTVSLQNCLSVVFKQRPNLLPSMLQGNAVVNHELHILYSERTIDDAIQHASMWLGHKDLIKGDNLVLKLSSNWQNEIAGLAFCVVVFNERLSKVNGHLEYLYTKEVERSPANRDRERHTWIGYISLKMIQRSIESSDKPTGWMDAVTQLHLTFGRASDVEWCACDVVWMQASRMSALSSEFTCSSLQQQKQLYFTAKMTHPCYTANQNDLLFYPEFWGHTTRPYLRIYFL